MQSILSHFLAPFSSFLLFNEIFNYFNVICIDYEINGIRVLKKVQILTDISVLKNNGFKIFKKPTDFKFEKFVKNSNVKNPLKIQMEISLSINEYEVSKKSLFTVTMVRFRSAHHKAPIKAPIETPPTMSIGMDAS